MTKRAAYENAIASSSCRPPTPPPIEQSRPSLPPLIDTPTIDELRQWMDDTGFKSDLLRETEGSTSHPILLLYDAMRAQVLKAQ